MQRRFATRRVALVAALAVTAGLTLAGCRNDPTVAARVGDVTITEDQVEAMYVEARDRAREQATKDAEAARQQGQTGQPTPTATPAEGGGQLSRGDVVAALVIGQACDKLQKTEKFTIVPVTPQTASFDMAQPDSSYLRERTRTESCLTSSYAGIDANPTDAELRDIYDRAVAGGIELPPFDQVKEELRADPGLRGGIARKHRLEQMVAAAEVTLNPRYAPMTWPVSFLRSGAPIIIATVDPGIGAVRDAAA